MNMSWSSRREFTRRGGGSLTGTAAGALRPFAAALLVLGLLTPSACEAVVPTVTFYTSSATFNAANPGLPVQTLSPVLNSAAYAFVASPLSSATPDAVFPANSLLPGITFSNADGGLASQGLIAYPDGLGNNYFGDTLVLTFSPGTKAVGETLFSRVGPGPTLGGNLIESVYDGSQLLGSMSLTEAPGTYGYLGASSLAPITSITLFYNSNSDGSALVNDIAFGVPEPAAGSVLLLAGALGSGWLARRRLIVPHPGD